MPKTKKILLLGWLGEPNFGDELILQAIVNELSKKQATIIAASLQPKLTEQKHSIKAINLHSLFALWREIIISDEVITLGGLWQQESSRRNIGGWWLRLLPIFFQKKIKLVILANGLNPLNCLNRRLFKTIIKRANEISWRDLASAELFKKYTNSGSAVVAEDPAWSLPTPNLSIQNKKLILWNLRPWINLGKVLPKIALAIKELSNLPQAFIAFSPADKKIGQRLNCLLPANQQLIIYENYFLAEKQLYWSAAACLITQRYHGSLWAAKQKIPTINFSHDPKISNLFNQLDIQQNILPWPNFTTADLLEKIKQLTLVE